jgi:hypothetical protein
MAARAVGRSAKTRLPGSRPEYTGKTEISLHTG